MSHFNHKRRKVALIAADPFSGAVAQVLLGEIVEPDWKSAKQHLSSLKVEVFAQNCSHVCILTLQPTCSPAGSPGAPHTEPAGAPTWFILAWTLLLSSCGQDGWSKVRLYFCTTGVLKVWQGGPREKSKLGMDPWSVCWFLWARMWLMSCLLAAELWGDVTEFPPVLWKDHWAPCCCSVIQGLLWCF